MASFISYTLADDQRSGPLHQSPLPHDYGPDGAGSRCTALRLVAFCCARGGDPTARQGTPSMDDAPGSPPSNVEPTYIDDRGEWNIHLEPLKLSQS